MHLDTKTKTLTTYLKRIETANKWDALPPRATQLEKCGGNKAELNQRTTIEPRMNLYVYYVNCYFRKLTILITMGLLMD